MSYRDLYYIIPLSADPETYSPDSRLVARCIMKGKGYYIAYSSAMYIHGLTDQPGARTAVVTERQRQPSIKNIKGTEFHFIYHTYSGTSISLLNPIGPDQGIKNSRFGLKINIEVNTLKDFLQS